MAETTPLKISGRYSSHDLAGDSAVDLNERKRSLTPDMHESRAAKRPRLATPDPRTPCLPSSILTAGYATDGSVFTTHTEASVLTVPDEKDEDDIVRKVAILDPFARQVGQCDDDGRVFDDSSLFGEEPVMGQYEGCELLPSVEITYANKMVFRGNEEACDRLLSREGASSQAQSMFSLERQRGTVEVIKEDKQRLVEHNPEPRDEDKVTDIQDTAMVDSQGDVANGETDSEYETNSNWDHVEEVQKRLREYEESKNQIQGHEKWTAAQSKLHKLLALRGCWPLLDATWAYNFSSRNIYDWVFAPAESKKRVALTARRDDFRATKAMETLFDLSGFVGSYCEMGTVDKISSLVCKTLRRFIKWAAYDAGVDDRSFIPTVEVFEFDPATWDAKMRRVAKATNPIIKTEPASEWDSDEEIDADPVTSAVGRRLRRLAARHRADLVIPETRHLPEYMWSYKVPPPLLHGFIVVQHMIMLVSLDASNPNNDIIVFTELNLSLADQWLWNGLALALPIHMARDVLWEQRERFPLIEVAELEDPDQ
jgi:hypothetical protein